MQQKKKKPKKHLTKRFDAIVIHILNWYTGNLQRMHRMCTLYITCAKGKTFLLGDFFSLEQLHYENAVEIQPLENRVL